MAWSVVTFDLENDQMPGINPQIALIHQAQETYFMLGCPENFALYQVYRDGDKFFTFYFTPEAAEAFAGYIQAYGGQLWDGPLPAMAEESF